MGENGTGCVYGRGVGRYMGLDVPGKSVTWLAVGLRGER